MSNIFFEFDGNKWEKFCEIMMRHHYTQPLFTSVPANDRGDCGLEFFTKSGFIFQCYFPNPTYSMDEYKKHIQKKINDDLKKLKKHEDEIKKFLDNIKIKQWVLLVPEHKSKDLIAYCTKKKNEVKSESISYIDNENFDVKIETPDSYPPSKIFALKYHNDLIKIPLKDIDNTQLNIFKNSTLDKNIHRKSSIISEKPDRFAKNMTEKYLKFDSYLEDLRNNYPDTYQEVEACGRSLLNKMKDLIEIDGMDPNIEFIKAVKDQNEKEINKLFSTIIEKNNMDTLPYGYISKWIAECNMDFE